MKRTFFNRKMNCSFIPINWLSFLMVLIVFPTITFGQPFLSKERLQVFDKNNVLVGEVIGIADDEDNPMWVALKIENQLIILRVFRSEFKGPRSNAAYFLDKKCEGTPFAQGPLVGGEAQMLPTAFVAPPGQTIYALDHEELSTTFYPQSKLSEMEVARP
jgi:hypothetical protein